MSGINLVANDADGKYSDISPKAKALEDKVYFDMSVLLGTHSFASSKWNHDALVIPTQCIFRATSATHDPRSIPMAEQAPTADTIISDTLDVPITYSNFFNNLEQY